MNEKEKAFTSDSRFQRIGKEAKMTTLFWIVYFILLMAAAFFLGAGDPAQYTYLFGFPLWFTVCIFIQLAATGVAIFLLKKKFCDVSLEADDPDYDYEKGAEK